MSFTTTPRHPRVTERKSVTVRMGSGDAPRSHRETGMTRDDRSMRHVESVDPETGFVIRVQHGRMAGLSVNPETGNYVLSEPTCAPNADDRRHPDRTDANGRPIATGSLAPSGPSRRIVVNGVTGARSIVDDNVNGGQITPRVVRMTTDGDNPLPGFVRPAKRHNSAPSSNDRAARAAERAETDAAIRATILSVTGHAYSGPIDARMRSMALDVMAHRASVAQYMAR
jgi:hypothetical protein